MKQSNGEDHGSHVGLGCGRKIADDTFGPYPDSSELGKPTIYILSKPTPARATQPMAHRPARARCQLLVQLTVSERKMKGHMECSTAGCNSTHAVANLL